MKTFGSTIRELREASGFSQSQLAERVFVTKGMISQIEGGRSYPSDEVLAALAKCFKISLSKLHQLRTADQTQQGRFKKAQQFVKRGNWEEALPFLYDCLADPHPNWSLFDIQQDIVTCWRGLGRFEEARLLLEKLLTLAFQEEAPFEAARVYNVLGQLALELDGKPEVAQEEWQRALREMEPVLPGKEMAELMTDLYLQLAEVHASFGETELALAYYMQAERWLRLLNQSVQKHKLAAVQTGYGNIYTQTDQFIKAKNALQKARSLYEQTKDPRGLLAVSILQATLLRKKGDWEAAVHLLLQCRDEVELLGDPLMLAKMLLEQAYHAHRVGDPESALQTTERADQLFVQQRRETERLDVYRLLMQLAKERGDYEQSDHWAQKAHQHMEMHLQKRGYGVAAWQVMEPLKPKSLRK